MPTLLLRFPAGRYHATPSGHHVNEGLVEWPPSPWRLLRALIACGYATQHWSEVPPAARRLVEALAGNLPRYVLPEASVAHSRHYMPTGALEKGRERTTLVFDTWANVGEGAVAVKWECSLDEQASALLGRLAAHLGYLGRSESWVLAEAVADDAELPQGPAAYPHVEGGRADRGWEQVSLLAAEPPGAYAAWRRAAVERALTGAPKATAKQRAKAEAPYPVDLIDCLERDTSWWKRHRWSQPPGSRRVLYWRRSDALLVSTPTPAAHRKPAPVAMMLLALTTPSGSRSPLPLRTRALPQGELLHRALVARAGRGERIDCPELTGRDEQGRPLTGHRHAHFLPLDLDGDGHLEHVLVWAPMGLGAEAQRAIRSLKETPTKGAGTLQVALAGQGALDRLRELPPQLAAGVEALLGPPAGARVWTSFTPFVPPRFLKPRGPNTLAGQVGAEVASRGLPPAAAVEVLPWDERTLDLRHSVRVRRHPAKPPPIDAGFALRLVFDVPIPGPLALGYAAHFGLGLFLALESPAN